MAHLTAVGWKPQFFATRTSTLSCLSVLTTWQLVNPRKHDQERARPHSDVLHDPTSEVPHIISTVPCWSPQSALSRVGGNCMRAWTARHQHHGASWLWAHTALQRHACLVPRAPPALAGSLASILTLRLHRPQTANTAVITCDLHSLKFLQ